MDIKKKKKSIFGFSKSNKKRAHRKHKTTKNKEKKSSKSILSLLGGGKDEISLNSKSNKTKATLDLGNGHNHRHHHHHHHHRKHKKKNKKKSSILNMFANHTKAIKNAHEIIEKVLKALRENNKDKKMEPIVKELELVAKDLD